MQRVQRQEDDDAIDNDNDDNYRNNDDDDDDDDDNEAAAEDVIGASESDIIYSIDAFGAVAVPVTITMVLSALVVVFINTEETIAAGERAFANTYQIFDLDDNDEEGSTSTSMWQKLGLSLVNTLVIVTAICFMTFIVVLCYKYKCMKILYGYLVIVTASLLGYFTSSMILVAISIYPWMNPDKLTFAFLMYNYAAVGTIAIFLPRGIPQWITQGYLIASSVCLAWQLSYFNSWMAWTLLVMLALYDLFAVLTPCGPLKYLAKMISKEGAPALPGLLYEANLSSGVAKPDRRNKKAKKKEVQRRRRQAQQLQHQRRSTSEEPDAIAAAAEEEEKQPEREDDNYHHDDDNDDNRNNNYVSNDSVEEVSPRRQAVGIPTPITKTTSTTMQFQTTSLIPDGGLSGRQQQIQQFEEQNGLQARGVMPSQQAQEDLVDMSNTGQVPLVLAKLYRLDVLDIDGILSSTDDNNRPRDQSYYTSEEIRNGSWTERQLRTEIKVIFPSGRSGTISKAPEQKYDAGVAYIVYDRLGNEEHKFVVTTQGTVMQVLRRESTENNDDDSTIKLGLGDFIFYSVLVSKAAQYSFTTFAACLLVVLTGLAATLVILAIKGKALPALPISIFLGVVTFLWTKTFVQPWIYSMLMSSFYV